MLDRISQVLFAMLRIEMSSLHLGNTSLFLVHLPSYLLVCWVGLLIFVRVGVASDTVYPPLFSLSLSQS